MLHLSVHVTPYAILAGGEGRTARPARRFFHGSVGALVLYNRVMKLPVTLVLALAALGHLTFVPAQQKGQEHWVATWTTAEMLARTPAPAQAPPLAPTGPPTPQSINARGFNHQTMRMTVRTSLGGRRARVRSPMHMAAFR